MSNRYCRIKLDKNKDNEDQIELGKSVLYLVSGAARDYTCIAGGAVRDWYLGGTANDIDIFVSGKRKSSVQSVKRTLNALLGVQCKELGDSSYENGEWFVLEFEVRGQVFQIIFGQNPKSTIKYDISKFYLEVTGDAVSMSNTLDGFKYKQFVGDKEDPYIQKMMKRYPDIKFLSNTDAELFVHLVNDLDKEEQISPALTTCRTPRGTLWGLLA